MSCLKISLSRHQHLFIVIFATLAMVYTYGWINDNSGLRPGNGAKIELARQLAKGCIALSLSLVYSCIAVYACHRWNKFRGQDSGKENTET